MNNFPKCGNKEIMAPSLSFNIRDAARIDVPAVASIYGFHVAHGTGTFEEVAPTVDEMQRRFDNVKARGLPWRVAETDGSVVGYCYVSLYNPRSAYKFTVQNSIYVHRSWQRRGIGLALLQDVIRTCQLLGYHQIIAAIGDSRNEATLRLHTLAGYRTIGHALHVGVKFGRWLDVVYMQRALGDPTFAPPDIDPTGYCAASDQTGP
jgi:L-amino acid N-acyltransferase YncA